MDDITIKHFTFDHEEPPELHLSSWMRTADMNCKVCFGRGYTGYSIELKRYIQCMCVEEPAAKKAREMIQISHTN